VADIETSESGSKEITLDNLIEEVTTKREAEPETVEAQPAAAPEAAPEPAPSWKDTVIGDDVDHGFFKGKKVEEAIKSYKHLEQFSQQKANEAAELRRRLEAIERQQQAEAAQRAQQPVAAPNGKTAKDLWFDDPEQAEALIRQQAAQEARLAARDEFQKFRQEDEQTRRTREIREGGERAWKGARETLGLDENTWNQRSRAILVELTDPTSPFYGDGHNVMRPEAYVETYKAIFGEPAAQPVIAVKATPELPTPPGSKKPAAPRASADAPSPLAKEQREAYRSLASAIGLDGDFAVQHAQKRRARG
jgi:hypothetical protein